MVVKWVVNGCLMEGGHKRKKSLCPSLERDATFQALSILQHQSSSNMCVVHFVILPKV